MNSFKFPIQMIINVILGNLLKTLELSMAIFLEIMIQ